MYVLFRLLNTAQGSLLDDEKLVNALQSSKATAIEVQEQLEISEQTEVKIDAAREVRTTYAMHELASIKNVVFLNLIC